MPEFYKRHHAPPAPDNDHKFDTFKVEMVVKIPKNWFTVEAARAYIPLTDKKVADENVIRSAQAKFISEAIRKGVSYGANNAYLIVSMVKLERLESSNRWIKGKPLREGEYWVVFGNDPERINLIEAKIYKETQTLWFRFLGGDDYPWQAINVPLITHYQPVTKPYCTHYDLGVQPPPVQRDQDTEKTRDELVSAAAEATEAFSEDELEQHAMQAHTMLRTGECITHPVRCRHCQSFVMADNGLCCNHACVFSEHKQMCFLAMGQTLQKGDYDPTACTCDRCQ